jgi:diadenosine tetraphosphatase ApaH/serine/threonine PP2A family protein phosphatase
LLIRGSPPVREIIALPTAVISDIHANASALRAVLADIEARGLTRIVCLGDMVGYGPDPLECVDLVMKRATWCLMGNHDYGVLYEPTNFNPSAESAAFWTREQFDREPDDALRASRYEFLNRLKVRVQERIGPDGPESLTTPDGAAAPEREGSMPLLAVHGSPRKPINEYIFPEDVINGPDKLESIFDKVPRICIVGHTHVPGVFTNEPDFYPPSELASGKFVFQNGEKIVINVGSVGQPRDRDNRASYVVLHGTHVEFVRLPYNIDETAQKIKAIPQLADWLGDRLYTGQ